MLLRKTLYEEDTCVNVELVSSDKMELMSRSADFITVIAILINIDASYTSVGQRRSSNFKIFGI